MKNKFRLPTLHELPKLKHHYEELDENGKLEGYWGKYTDNVWILDMEGNWQWGCFYAPFANEREMIPQKVLNGICLCWMYGKKKDKPTKEEAIEAMLYVLLHEGKCRDCFVTQEEYNNQNLKKH